mmetsp:Transcript_25407/g.69001  ORF Transcript_25407/g.69001 Transcript_25407/m.69001 type:complete len:104 (-) Transcript_25407:1187-1498(-)
MGLVRGSQKKWVGLVTSGCNQMSLRQQKQQQQQQQPKDVQLQQQHQQQQKQEAWPKPATAPSSPSDVRRIHLPPIHSKRAQLSDEPLPQLRQQQDQGEGLSTD